jgi:hypothetical protein
MNSIPYRILTAWINDVSASPNMGERWPMVGMTDGLVRDYFELIDLAADWGYNGIVAWGLFVGHNWPVRLEDCLDDRRKRRILRIFDYAQRRGITMYVGLGVYSWGFEEIVRANPSLCQGEQVKAWGVMQPHNGDAMCYHQDEARAWMRRIVDFIVRETDAPAFQLQPFDKGRCMCDRCGRMSDAAYFSALIAETASYIKGRWPEKTVGVSGWGMMYDSMDDLPAVQAMAAHIDYLSDVTNSSREKGRAFRRAWINGLPCAFGDSAGGSVTPPQTWARLRWYLPHIRFNGTSIRETAQDRGGVAEVFAGPLNNPGTRVSLMALGRLLCRPDMSIEEAACAAVSDAYGIQGSAAEALAALVLQAEDAYFVHCAPGHTGDILFEALTSVFPGKPLYLLGREPDALRAYKEALSRVAADMDALRAEIRRETLLDDTLTAIRNAMAEADEVLRGAWK